MSTPLTKRDMHRMALDEAQSRMADLMDELDQLEAVESYHREKLEEMGVVSEKPTDSSDSDGGNNSTATPLIARQVKGKSKHEAAEIALKAIGHPVRLPAILESLIAVGYGKELSRKILHNSIFTAMTRKEETFVKETVDGVSLWGLKNWPKSGTKTENAT